MLRSAASAELVMSSAAILLGIILQQVSDLGQDIVVVALYAVMAVLAFAVWRSRRWMTEHAQMLHPSNSENELKDVCVRIAREKQLTPRETDVLELLAEERSRPYIMEKLFISEATVKTHTAHVYEKLGIHNKQQLIELVRMR